MFSRAFLLSILLHVCIISIFVLQALNFKSNDKDLTKNTVAIKIIGPVSKHKKNVRRHIVKHKKPKPVTKP